MSQNKNTKKTTQKSKGKKDWSFYVIVVSCIILAIPVLFLGYVAISASRTSGKPINGDRFKNDLNPAIEESQKDSIVTKLKEKESVTDAVVELKTATLRVYIFSEGANQADLEKLSDVSYEVVASVLDPKVYFTIKDIQKQYDLEIYVFNQKEVSEESKSTYVNVLLWKSSNMTEPTKQVVTNPKSQDAVDYFKKVEAERDENNAQAEAENSDS